MNYIDDDEELASEKYRLLQAEYLLWAVSVPDDEAIPDFDEWLESRNASDAQQQRKTR